MKIILAITFVFFISCMPYVKKETRGNLVRVALICGVDQVVVSGIRENKFFEDYAVSLKDTFPIFFGSQQGTVKVNGKSYRGNLEIRKNGGRIWVINVVEIEDYLKGVVPCEIGGLSESLIEAAEAQAVAARTYTYQHLGQFSELGFDLYATVQDQVYNGLAGEDKITNMAVDKTRSEVLVWNNEPIEAKYHSTCGGRTADFDDAWPGSAPPYLRSVRCPYCQNSPHYTWTKKYDKQDFFKTLRSQLSSININLTQGELIESIKLLKNRRSGRVNTMFIKTNKDEYRIASYNIRKILAQGSSGLLKSTYFDLKIKGDSLVIEGHGFGHGVGMCQFGAIEMARRGKSYREILRHYYPKTKIAKK